MIKVHGHEFASPEQGFERLAVLREQNAQWGPSDGRVTEYNAIKAALDEHFEQQEARAKERERPYVVLYRKARKDGSVFKGRRRFKTDAEQARFIREAPGDVAVTFYTT